MGGEGKGGEGSKKIKETGKDSCRDGVFKTPYQSTEAQLAAAIAEAARTGGGIHSGRGVAVHATAEPGTGYAVAAGVASVDHAYQLSEATMKAMHEKTIYACPTFQFLASFPPTPGP